MFRCFYITDIFNMWIIFGKNNLGFTFYYACDVTLSNEWNLHLTTKKILEIIYKRLKVCYDGYYKNKRNSYFICG